MAENRTSRRKDRQRDEHSRDGRARDDGRRDDRSDERSRDGRPRKRSHEARAGDERSSGDRSRDGRPRKRSREARASDERSGGDRSRSRAAGRSDQEKARTDGHAGRQPSLGTGEIARLAMEQVVGLTGRDADGVTSLERTDDGWSVGVEIVETHRIPDSADILATYAVDLDGAGGLVAYRRVRRYSRSQIDRE